jgi:hypothetical protein
MAYRPIIFSAPMVKALLEEEKTMTRRLLKPPRKWAQKYPLLRLDVLDDGLWFWDGENDRVGVSAPTPYTTGDRLWVREAFSGPHGYTGTPPRDWLSGCDIWYWADGNPEDGDWTKPKPGMHMPRWASRMTLTVTGVKVERLQEISEEDAQAEGVEGPGVEREDHDWSICPQCGGTCLYNGLSGNLGVMPDCDCYECDTHRKRFMHLWNHLHGPDAWAANPWVVAVGFSVALRNIDVAPTP